MTESVTRVTGDPIDGPALLDGLASSHDGAALLFLGVVRDHHEGRDVAHLEYEAYVEMAERTLAEIAAEAAGRWETGEIRVVHRLGRLEVGEASVAIAVASPHRDGAYQASRYIIEELKKRAPIWKREGYVEGESEWLSGTEPVPRDTQDE
jgi:molybdopterin synthase catalytic subunit